MMGGFVPGYIAEDRSLVMEHRDGIPWWEAPIPRRFHWCKPQTNGLLNYFTLVQRCACGAINTGHGWHGRNTKREQHSWPLPIID